MFKSIDVSDSGSIEFSEFVLAVVNKNSLLTRENLACVFGLFDYEKNNKVTFNEFKRFFNDMGK